MTPRVSGGLYWALGMLTSLLLVVWLVPLGDGGRPDPMPVSPSPPPTATAVRAYPTEPPLSGLVGDVAALIGAQVQLRTAAEMATMEASFDAQLATVAALIPDTPTPAPPPTRPPYVEACSRVDGGLCHPDDPTPPPTPPVPSCETGQTVRRHGTTVCDKPTPTPTPTSPAPPTLPLSSPPGSQ